MTPSSALEMDWFRRWALYSPQRVAIRDPNGHNHYTYQQSYHLSQTLAAHLRQKFDIQRGDRVAVFSQNNLEFVVAFLALWRLGAIMVPVNFRLAPPEVGHVLQDARPKLVLFQDSLLAILEKARAHYPALSFDQWALCGNHSLATFLSKVSREGAAQTEIPFVGTLTDPCMILYTSGTTGSPKGAVLTNQMLFWNAINTGLRLNLTSADSTVIFLPFFHTSGWNVLTTPFWFHGSSVSFLEKFSAPEILACVQEQQVSILFGVPTTMDMLSQHPDFTNTNFSHVRYAIVGGEPMSETSIRTWAAKGVPIRQGYGLTEFGPNVFSLNQEDAIRKIGSIGFPNFFIDTQVVNNEGQTLGPNQVGELLLRGPCAMREYWHNPKATGETLSADGWLHTGDLVRFDEEGYYYVVGRKKEMYISGGENVYPAEIEKVLHRVPGVREAAVVGVPDPKWGEAGAAFLAVEESSTVDTEQIRQHLLSSLAKYKVPRYIAILPTLPKTDSGKIRKRDLAHNWQTLIAQGQPEAQSVSLP